MEAPPSPLSSRAQPRDLQFCRLVLEMFFEEAVWVLRPVGPTAKRQPSPGGLGHRFPTLSERRRRGTLSPQPASVPCRKTFPGRACRTADPSAALGMTKGRVALSLSVHWLMERTAGPSTSLRSGRDDNSYLGTECECPRKVVIRKKSQTPSAAEGFAVERTLLGNVFQQRVVHRRLRRHSRSSPTFITSRKVASC